MARKNYTSFQLINPIISGWQHDTMDNSVSDPVQSTMTLIMKLCIIVEVQLVTADLKGLHEEHYDKTPSPNSLAGGGCI